MLRLRSGQVTGKWPDWKSGDRGRNIDPGIRFGAYIPKGAQDILDLQAVNRTRYLCVVRRSDAKLSSRSVVKFCWVTINVKDMDASLRFYQEIIGLPLNRRMKPNPFIELAFLGSGETQVELIWNAKSDAINIGSDISIGFEVESLDKTVEALQKNAVAVHSGPFQPNPSIRFLFVLDPDGLKVQFVENIRR